MFRNFGITGIESQELRCALMIPFVKRSSRNTAAAIENGRARPDIGPPPLGRIAVQYFPERFSASCTDRRQVAIVTDFTSVLPATFPFFAFRSLPLHHRSAP